MTIHADGGGDDRRADGPATLATDRVLQQDAAAEPAAQPDPCPACGEPSLLNYCAACGERRFDPEHLTLRHFARESVAQVSNLDSTFVRSFRSLIARAGELSAAYLSGRRKLFLRPLQIFLLCNVTFFFVEGTIGRSNIFSTPLQTHLYGVPYRTLTQRLVMERTAQRGITPLEYERSFNAIVERQSKTLVILMVPIFALLLGLTYAWSGRPAVTHLVFSMHLYSYFLLVITALVVITTMKYELLTELGVSLELVDRHFDRVVTLTVLTVMACYIALGQRRVYGTGWPATLVRTAVLLVGLMVSLTLYRLALFFTSFWLA